MSPTKQWLALLVLATILGLGRNLVTDAVPWVAEAPILDAVDSTVVPPNAQEGDPPYLAFNSAYTKFETGDAIFLDARDPVEYNEGHIPGAINMPFDWYDDYWDQVKPLLDPDREIVTYCSGVECELSMYLARQLVIEGYTNVFIFYGGWDDWQRKDLPVEGAEEET